MGLCRFDPYLLTVAGFNLPLATMIAGLAKSGRAQDRPQAALNFGLRATSPSDFKLVLGTSVSANAVGKVASDEEMIEWQGLLDQVGYGAPVAP